MERGFNTLPAMIPDDFWSMLEPRLNGEAKHDDKVIRDLCATFQLKPRIVLAAMKARRRR
jgi:hypothetical protein